MCNLLDYPATCRLREHGSSLVVYMLFPGSHPRRPVVIVGSTRKEFTQTKEPRRDKRNIFADSGKVRSQGGPGPPSYPSSSWGKNSITSISPPSSSSSSSSSSSGCAKFNPPPPTFASQKRIRALSITLIWSTQLLHRRTRWCLDCRPRLPHLQYLLDVALSILAR